MDASIAHCLRAVSGLNSRLDIRTFGALCHAAISNL